MDFTSEMAGHALAYQLLAALSGLPGEGVVTPTQLGDVLSLLGRLQGQYRIASSRLSSAEQKWLERAAELCIGDFNP